MLRTALAALGLVALAASVFGCNLLSGDSGAPGPGPTGSGAGLAAGQATSTGDAQRANPSLAAIAAGTWKDPAGGPEVKLKDTPLDKCYGFKGFSMKLPEGTQIKTLMGARACYADFPSAKKGANHLAVISDELDIGLLKKEAISPVLEKPYEGPDSFLYKSEEKGKVIYRGWWEKKMGKHTIRCSAIQDDVSGEYPYDTQRAMIELCRTLQYAAL